MYADSNILMVELLKDIIQHENETRDKPGDHLTNRIWQTKGMMLNVVTVNGIDLPGQGTMTVTNVHYSRYPFSSSKKGIFCFQIEVDAQYWEGKKIAYLEYLNGKACMQMVVDGPTARIDVNAYVVTKG